SEQRRCIWTVTASGGDPVAVINDMYANSYPVWSPDGGYLYFNSDRNGRLGIWRVAIDEVSGRALAEPELVPTPSTQSYELSIAGDGRRMVYTSRRESANLFRVPFDARRAVIAGDPVQITFSGQRLMNVSVSPDGKS